MLKIGLIGLGAMGRLHFDCWQKSGFAGLVAVADGDPKKRSSDWSEPPPCPANSSSYWRKLQPVRVKTSLPAFALFGSFVVNFQRRYSG
ncbi:MAG: hypothetical protein ABI680_01840 [Chthoniobacteraceae bacterium]